MAAEPEWRRSRSPGPRKSANTERISRAIVSFGRYAHNRPPGLHVDVSGNFSLRNLMQVWGQHEGLTEEDVLGAVRAHMFHENEPGELRFAIGGDEEGNILIRVLPKRGHRACATPSRSQWQQQQGWPWAPTVPKGGGTPAKLTPAPKLTPGPGAAVARGAAAPSASLEERLDSSLDEVIEARAGRKDAPTGRRPSCGRGSQDAWFWSLAEARGRRGGGGRRGGRRRGGGRQGWSWPEEEAAADGQDSGLQQHAPTGEGGGADLQPRRGRPRAISSSSSSSGRSRCSARARVPSTSSPPEVRRAAQEEAAAGQPPPRPPGAYWTQYQDNGVYWWHYEGPCGQWFCATGEEPQPYVPDPPEPA